jgi:hypothetical protein
MVETTLTDNINVSNVVTLPISNGTVLFTHVKPAIKQHLDMHRKHVKDVFTMMESVDTMILMDTISVAVTRAGVFANLWNKIGKILKIFERLDYLRSRWVLCQL